jgi:tetratricopeptide (TPR) repeat protein
LELCYGLLEVGRHRQACRHGERALVLAERLGDSFGIKNSLYLLGEAERLLGRDERARACFDRLQSLFPDTPFLTDMLMAVDLRQMINLRA